MQGYSLALGGEGVLSQEGLAQDVSQTLNSSLQAQHMPEYTLIELPSEDGLEPGYAVVKVRA